MARFFSVLSCVFFCVALMLATLAAPAAPAGAYADPPGDPGGGAGGDVSCPTYNTCKVECNNNGCIETYFFPGRCSNEGSGGCNDGDCAKCQCYYRMKCASMDNACICW